MSDQLSGIPPIGTLVEVVTQSGKRLAHVTGDAWPADLGVEVPVQFTVINRLFFEQPISGLFPQPKKA